MIRRPTERYRVVAMLLALLSPAFLGGAAPVEPTPVPAPTPRPSPIPTQAIPLPPANGAWRATLTVTGGKIARFEEYVIASDGNAVSTQTGNFTLDVHAFANVASAVDIARDVRWSVPKESTCCDRVVTHVTLERRLPNALVVIHETQTAQSGTPLPPDAATVVSAMRDAFAR